MPRPAPVMIAIRPSSAPMSTIPCLLRSGDDDARRHGRHWSPSTLSGLLHPGQTGSAASDASTARGTDRGTATPSPAVTAPTIDRTRARSARHQHIFGIAQVGDSAHLAAGGIVDADPGAHVPGRVEGQDLHMAPSGTELHELVEAQP